MKVLLVNGSSRPDGCTATALKRVSDTLAAEGLETETLHIGNEPLHECAACGHCRRTGECVYDDVASRVGRRAAEFDGFVFGSPVYYAHPSARLLAFLDRAFYAYARHFQFKPAAAVLSARRAGNVASMDVINKHFSICSMPVVSSNYWNHVHGRRPEDVLQDEEGLMTLTNLAKNMAWLLKCIDLGRQNGLNHPVNEKVLTHFIR